MCNHFKGGFDSVLNVVVEYLCPLNFSVIFISFLNLILFLVSFAITNDLLIQSGVHVELIKWYKHTKSYFNSRLKNNNI